MSQTTNISGKTLFTRNTWRVSIGGMTIGIFTGCSGLAVEFEVLEYAEGGNNDMLHHLPGRVRYSNLVLSRGLTDEKALMDWFWKTHSQAEKKEVTVTLEQAGAPATRAWTFADAYPVRWSGPDLEANSMDVAGETLEIAHSGIQQV
jgi:phage tail-like protein